MNIMKLTIKSLEESIAYNKAHPLPKKTLIDTGRPIPFPEGDITGLAKQVISITL